MIRVSGLKFGVCALVVLGYVGGAKPTLAITGGAWQTKVVNWTRVPANDPDAGNISYNPSAPSISGNSVYPTAVEAIDIIYTKDFSLDANEISYVGFAEYTTSIIGSASSSGVAGAAALPGCPRQSTPPNFSSGLHTSSVFVSLDWFNPTYTAQIELIAESDGQIADVSAEGDAAVSDDSGFSGTFP